MTLFCLLLALSVYLCLRIASAGTDDSRARDDRQRPALRSMLRTRSSV
jgi:hypothetical protein